MSLEHVWHWLLSPLSGASTHQLDGWVIWHARSMVLAWAILLPVGAIAARYFKVTTGQDWPHVTDNRTWWHAHRSLQYSGVLIMLIGIYLAWDRSTSLSLGAQLHSYIGWGVIALGIVQIFSAWFRGSKGGPTEPQLRGDHYDMTTHRLLFEGIHKSVGWIAVAAAVITIVLGLWIADAPRWMLIVLMIWWLALAAWCVQLERTGRCIDTYQAIWGTDPKHPGNLRPHVGWGMLRHMQTRERL